MSSADPVHVAVVVPVLDDTAALALCLANLEAAREPLEIHVVDGGPDPAAQELCRQSGVHYHTSPPGRAAQLNHGAAQASAPWLWFLHADTSAGPGAVHALHTHTLTADPGWGCFRTKIAHPSPWLRVIEGGANLRARLGLPYGDQGMFAHRDLFRAVGGFPAEPILEDALLSKALRRVGRPRLLSPPIQTSGRRWRTLGIARTTWINWRILGMHLAGSRNTRRMAQLYGRRQAP